MRCVLHDTVVLTLAAKMSEAEKSVQEFRAVLLICMTPVRHAPTSCSMAAVACPVKLISNLLLN